MKKKEIEKVSLLLDEYNNNYDVFNEFSNLIGKKLEIIAIENEIKYQHLSIRVKNYYSLKNKLLNRGFGKVIESVIELNDLIGARMVFYFSDELEAFSNLISGYFNVCEVKSRIDMDENRDVLYSAEHYILKLKEKDIKNDRFKEFKFELQLMPTLYHAASEVGHDIFYVDKYDNKLRLKNPVMYEKMEKARKDAWKKILEAQEDFDFINNLSKNIAEGYEMVQYILSNNFLLEIDNINDFEKANNLLSKLNAACEYIVSEEQKNKVQLENIFDHVMDMLFRLQQIPDENKESIFHILNNVDYVFDGIVKFIKLYIYTNPEIFPKIIKVFHDKGKEKESFKTKGLKALKDIISFDKQQKLWIINQILYEWLVKTGKDIEYLDEIVEFADEFLNLEIEYFVQTSEKEFSFSRSKLLPTEQFIEKYVAVSKTLLDLLMCTNNSKKLIDVIVKNCRVHFILEDNENHIFLDKTLEFFKKHYDKISNYYKLEFCIDIHIIEKNINISVEQKEFLDTIKNDEIINIYKIIFSYHIYEMNYSEFEIKRKRIIDNILEEMEESKEKFILDMINFESLNRNNNISLSTYKELMFNIGLKFEKIAIDILNILTKEKKEIESCLLLGCIASKDGSNLYEKHVKNNENVALNILTEMRYVETNTALIREIYSDFNGDIQIQEAIINIINRKKIWNDEFSKIFFNALNMLNKNNIAYNWDFIFDDEQFKKILNTKRINSIIKNLKLNKNRFRCEILKTLYEFSPDKVRNYLEEVINEKYFSTFEAYWFKEAKNINDEFENNLLWVIKILKKDSDSRYKLGSLVENLVGPYSSNVENKLIKILEKDHSFENIYTVIKFLEFYDNILVTFNLVKKIIEYNNSKEIVDSLGGIVYNSFGSGEYGLSEVTQKKIDLFNTWKDDSNENISSFARKEIKFLKIIKEKEEKDTKMRGIKNNRRYELLNKEG